jgi:hypothetical protein
MSKMLKMNAASDLKWEVGGSEDTQLQQIRPARSTAKHVHWDWVTAAVLTLGSVVFWWWGKQERARQVSSSSTPPTQAQSLGEHPPTVALALLPRSVDPSVTPPISVRFTSPETRSTVGATLSVKGVIRGAGDAQPLWLITVRDREQKFLPKDRVLPDEDGRFELTTWDYGPDGRMSLCLMVTTDKESRRFEDWLAVGYRDDEWPALPLAEGSRIVDCQQVELKKHVMQ